jgi:glycosyltransferase involved in cell wall biosynthesis
MEQPLISVIIPAFNAEKYLAEALQSIALQTYGNWEVLVTEDGSADRTKDIVAEFATAHPGSRIVYLRHRINRGLGATRNSSLGQARGMYHALLDHDDVWLPRHLEQALDALLTGAADLVYSTAAMFDAASDTEIGMHGPDDDYIRDWPTSLYFRKNAILPSSVVMHRGVYGRVGGFARRRAFHGCEDYDYWLRCCRAGVRIRHLPEVTCRYRRHHGALSSRGVAMSCTIFAVLNRHRHWQALDRTRAVNHVFDLARRLAWLHEELDPRRSAYYFLQAWRLRPADLGLLKLACRKWMGTWRS